GCDMIFPNRLHPAQERRSHVRKRALVVDGDVLTRIETRLLLELQGYQVEEVSDGMEAIDLMDLDSPTLDLVVLDRDMPLLDGMETLQALRALQTELGAIVCLGEKEAEHEDILQDRIVFARKPLGMQALVECLDRLHGAKGRMLDHGHLSQSHKVRISGHLPHYPPR
ncbi:MAG TPA: response regulator, partial [Holophaga sp.]|nr:response regulator [Holophaga sp.]